MNAQVQAARDAVGSVDLASAREHLDSAWRDAWAARSDIAAAVAASAPARGEPAPRLAAVRLGDPRRSRVCDHRYGDRLRWGGYRDYDRYRRSTRDLAGGTWWRR